LWKDLMQRILLVVIVLLIVWRILASIGRRLSEKAPGADSFSRFSPEARRRRQAGSDARTMEELVECTVCGTFVPAGRALTDGDSRVFCSEDCRLRLGVSSEHERD
jgi:ribosomal protein L32